MVSRPSTYNEKSQAHRCIRSRLLISNQLDLETRARTARMDSGALSSSSDCIRERMPVESVWGSYD